MTKDDRRAKKAGKRAQQNLAKTIARRDNIGLAEARRRAWRLFFRQTLREETVPRSFRPFFDDLIRRDP